MLSRIVELPLFVLVIGGSGLAMALPAVHALVTDDGVSARGFGYAALLTLVLFAMVGLATWNHKVRHPTRANLLSILAFYAALPALLAWPMTAAMDGLLSYGDAVFDMVSAITTTGAPILPLNATPSSVHLWRAEVAWFGGFFVWVTAIAVLAPLNLGGFEVAGNAAPGRGAESFTQISRLAGPEQRVRRFARMLFPIYTLLTVVLWLALMIAGDPPLVAMTHAMSTLSTSGLSPLGGPSGAASGLGGEALILLFLVFALSRLTVATEERDDGLRSLLRDPELRLGLLIVGTLPVLLFLRHWLAAFEAEEAVSLLDGLEGLWGGLFTTASFLTTTGWESGSWDAALSWSGLRTPGLVLMGLAIFGGGVATTAGGVKLLRVYALYKHGLREMEKLVQPSSIGGAGQAARRFRREGAYLAWIAFMLFALSIAVVWLALAFTGIGFETALVLTIASLTTCGPLIEAATTQTITLLDLSPAAKTIMGAAMVLGRLEALAVIALLNPDFWRG
ncbi:MAG: potassium transporter TrkG [Paracoccaceae bacterium]|nr:potassium transporter TrkG [Paracoccaceae bacterium]